MKDTEGLDFSNNSSIHFETTEDEYLSLPILKQNVITNKGKEFSYEIHHTIHSQRRASQRSIDYRTILAILHYGTPFPLQHLIFYTIEKGALPRHVDRKLREKTRNLVLVTADNDTTIITCYKAKNAMKYISQKTKTLR